MNTAPDNNVSNHSLQLVALLCTLATTPAFAADLIKADNTTNLTQQTAYTNATAATAAADTLVFNNTLANNSTFAWTADTVTAVRIENPANAITINLGSLGTASSITMTNNTGTGNSGDGVVINMTSATQDLTFSALNAGSELKLRGNASGTNLSIATGRTLTIQTNMYHNNGGGLAAIRVVNGGNLLVNGANGRISDKDGSALTPTAFIHDGTGTVTFSNANTYSGGTTINSGTLVAANSAALGGGATTISGGTLDMNGASALDLTFAANKDLTLSAGTVKFNLGTASDQITGSGTGKFNITGGVFEFALGDGFSYSSTYQLLEGFDAGTSIVSGLTFTGFDTAGYEAILNSAGQLTFVAIPEPSSFAVLAGGLALVACVGRRRSSRGA